MIIMTQDDTVLRLHEVLSNQYLSTYPYRGKEESVRSPAPQTTYDRYTEDSVEDEGSEGTSHSPRHHELYSPHSREAYTPPRSPQPVKRNPYNYYGESAVYNSRPVYGDTEEQRGYPSQPHYVPAVQPDYPQYGPPPSTARPSVARIVVRPRPEASSQYAAPPRKEVRPPRRQKQAPPPPRYQEDDEEEEYDGEATGGAGSIPGSPQQDYPILSSVPRTDFSCRDKVPGFYADMEHRCQLYYLCGPQGTYQSFLCPNGTVFNQQSFVCEWWYNVDCGQAGKFYELNHNLYKQPEPEDQQELSQKPRSSRKLRTRRPPPPEMSEEENDNYSRPPYYNDN
ncbi:hypothetical protein LAZ67_1002977 [Cordylochernes scorpioides]|uniref:Chitin-binding type-2 domain-containing protein n=1 Tax=Cordylochernes scorpioides TaxID=51811 RepID=A0ABY6JZE5_9ARAC|nr:hypothetical protein LAZ67_1002977 [Cordylochernes scorpioides]